MSANTAAGLMAGRSRSATAGRCRSAPPATPRGPASTFDAGTTRLLASMSWANLLIRETNRTGNQAYTDRARAFAADFMRDNPVGAALARPTPGPRCTRASARRSSPAELNRRTTPGRDLADRARHLAGRAANHGGDWNQGLEAAIGLLGAGCRLGRADFRTTASSRLAR